jgi:transposase
MQNEETTFEWFVGIDWGTTSHAVAVSDATGRVVGERTIAHSSAGLADGVAWIRQLAAPDLAQVAVAIEVPRGAVVDLFLERGAAVFAVNPKQLDRFRDRFSVAGAKDDRLDARVLASAVRTDRSHFQRLRPDAPRVIQLRELTRASQVLQEEFGALTNRLRELVHRIAPQWLTLSTNADDAWFWALVAMAATATRGQTLRRGPVARVLRAHRIRRVTPEDVLAVLRTAPLTLAPGTLEAVCTHVHLLLPRIRLVDAQWRECTRAVEAVLAALSSAPPDDPDTPPGPSDVAIMQSVPGIGTGVTASLIADAPHLIHDRNYAALRAVTGVAPVRRQTGKNKRGLVGMRYACNHRLRNACYHWARVSTTVDAAARTYYQALRARGHSHGRALRSVADRWLRILMAMLEQRTLYDPTRFTPVPPAT